MNNYQVIHLIDGILVRLHPVAPPFEHRHDGPRQWLYLAEPKVSYETELARLASVLSDPSFPPSEERLQNGNYQLDDGTESSTPPPPRLASGLPLPRTRAGQVAYSVDFHLVQALSGLRAVLLVLIDSCARCALDEDFIGRQPWTDSTTVIVAMSQWSESDFVPNAKYWKDWPLARFLRNPLPPVPDSWTVGRTATLFSGETGRYMSRIATYPGDRPNSMFYYRAVFGLSQSKRGFAEVPRSFVKKAMLKHSRQLSTPPKSEPDLNRVKIFAQTFFEKFRCPKIFVELPHLEASTKASVEQSRVGGGARSFLRHLISEHHGVSVNEPVFVGMRQHNTPEVFEERGLPPLSSEEWQDLVASFGPAESVQYLHPNVQGLVGNLIREYPRAKAFPIARVAEVLEPLKVRLVTAMNAVRSHAARPLQKALWRFLRSSPVFRLIGEPITESLIHDLVTRHRKRGGGEDPWNSGDFSAATDGLDIRVSKVILEVILEHLDPVDAEFREEIASILLEQIITYPPWTGIKPIVQENGQLMGSVLSFPLLCLANLFAYIESQPDADEILFSRSRMDKLAVLINGDDILFRSSDAGYSSWLVEIAKVGFVPSVGKNFRHPRFFTVNSVPIEYRPAPTPGQFWQGWSWYDMEESPLPWDISQVPDITIGGFLNVGLLTGQAKLTGREALGALPLSGWHAGAVIEALNPSQAHKWFLKYHRQEIQTQTRFGSTTLNIFAHPLLGGLGFQVPEGVEPRYSPEQRRIAQALFLSAQYTFEAKEKDFSLKTLLFLECDTAAPMSSLGRTSRRVEVELYPEGTPLPEGYVPFVDQSGVQPLAMVHGIEHPDEEIGLRARCRLSANRLKQLTKRFDTDVIDLHPVERMTEFPYIPVRVSRSSVPEQSAESSGPDDSKPTERPYSRVYIPAIPFQDIPPPVPEGDRAFYIGAPDTREPFLSDNFFADLSRALRQKADVIQYAGIPSEVEDWEDADTTLVAPVSTPAPSRPIRNRTRASMISSERRRDALNRGYVS